MGKVGANEKRPNQTTASSADYSSHAESDVEKGVNGSIEKRPNQPTAKGGPDYSSHAKSDVERGAEEIMPKNDSGIKKD